MGYYADLIKAKQNAKLAQEKRNSYGKRIETVGECDIYEDSNGYFFLVKGGRIIKKGYYTKEEAERDARRVRSKSELVKIAKDFYFYDKWTKQHIADSLKRTELGITDEEIKRIFDEAGIRNSKEEKDNSILSTEMYKGYKIEVYKAKAGVDYGFNIYDKSGALFDWGTYFDSERDALRWAKLAIDRKKNSKEKSEERTNSLSDKAKRIISKAVAEARFDYKTAIDFAIADLKSEKEWAWTSHNEVSQMVQRLIKNRMEFGLNSDGSKEYKENTSSNFYSLVAEAKRKIDQKYQDAVRLAKNKYDKNKDQRGAENIFSEEVKKANDEREKSLQEFWKQVSEEHR